VAESVPAVRPLDLRDSALNGGPVRAATAMGDSREIRERRPVGSGVRSDQRRTHSVAEWRKDDTDAVPCPLSNKV